MAHARRRFYEAQSSNLMRSTVMLAYIRLLYDVEREARDMKLNGEKRLALRLAESVRILDDTKTYLEREKPNVPPKSPEGQAITYALSNWKALTRYCEDGDLAIDNNGADTASGIGTVMPHAGLCRVRADWVRHAACSSLPVRHK
jgi:hypothetical protein